MKKMKYVVLILIAAAELVYLLFCISGICLYSDGRDAEMLAFIISLSFHAAVMLAATIGGVVRLSRGKRFSLIKNILMLPVWTIIALGISYFTVVKFEDSHIAGIFCLVVGLIFMGLMHLRLPQNQNNTNSKQLSGNCFTHIKAEWLWEEAAMEYCSMYGKSIDDLTEQENDTIYEYAGNYIAYFMAWLIKHDYFVYYSDKHYFGYSEEIKSERKSPIELLRDMDYCLSMEHIDNSLRFFMTEYFKCTSSFIGNYREDYMSVMRQLGSYDYCVGFSWDIYRRIEILIDKSFKEYTIQTECDNLEMKENFHCGWLGSDISIQTAPNVPKEYIERCVKHLCSMSFDMRNKIRDMIIENMFVDGIPEYEIINKSCFDCITIYTPYGEEPAYSLGGEPGFEEEHGMAVMIRGDRILDVGYRCDIEYTSPWNKEYETRYESMGGRV